MRSQLDGFLPRWGGVKSATSAVLKLSDERARPHRSCRPLYALSRRFCNLPYLHTHVGMMRANPPPWGKESRRSESHFGFHANRRTEYT